MYNVAIVGATGLVGGTFLKVLAEQKFPIKNLKLLASARSAGKIIEFCGKEYVVEELKETSFEGIDLVLFSAGGDISRKYAPIAESYGCIVIDNSSCFRNDADKALVVPEVNPEDAKISRIISNPNCSTIQSIVPLKAIDDKYGLKRVVYTTYQAVSGSGMKGIKDLEKIVLRMVASLNSMQKCKDRLIEITADGEISDDEIKDFVNIQEELDKISLTVDSLKLWSEQMLANGIIDKDKYIACKNKKK